MTISNYLPIGRAAAMWAAAVVLATGLGGGPTQVRAEEPFDAPTMALLPPAAGSYGSAVEIPRPLSETDADRYRDIFRMQEAGEWKAADRLIGKLTDLRLVGHALAQRYLHPTAYKASFKELRDWLAKYADHPEARRIHALAMARKPAGAAAPAVPNASVRKVGAPDPNFRMEGAQWSQGMAAWRKGDMTAAARHFERAAQTADLSPWTVSAAAYWAARSHLKDRKPEQVSRWLRVAADYPRTFYGQLARRALGMESAFDWSVRPLTAPEAKALLKSRTGQRALALLQIGQEQRAEDEMQILQSESGPEIVSALISISQIARLPSLALRLGVAVESAYGTTHEAALYPLPHWQPAGGFTVDRALLYALMRQESGFNPDARSQVGASGLMQLMPATASFMAGDESGATGKGKALFDPEINIALGQRYVDHLLSDANVNGDLFLLAAAYNAGPGNLAKWRKRADYDHDPLLFLESIPARETRMFVQRVLTNLWIYRQRLGQGTPSLDAIASGAWPTYDPQDLALVSPE